MEGQEPAQVFVQRFPPVNVRTVPSERFTQYEGRLPAAVLDIWRQGGFGKYGGGLLEVIDPHEYQDVLNEWLGRSDDTRIPVLMTAFGVVYYWRLLGERQADGEYEGADMAYFNPHDSSTGVCAWDADEFFWEYLHAPGSDEAPYELDPYFLWENVQGQASADLTPGQIYAFRLALRLGGAPEAEQLTPMAAREHLALLFSLTQGEEVGLFDDPAERSGRDDSDASEDGDLYVLSEYQERERELRAELHTLTDPAERLKMHVRLANLLKKWPWHEEDGDPSENMQALGHRLEAEFGAITALDDSPQWLYERADSLLDKFLFDRADEADALYRQGLAAGFDPIRGHKGLIRRAWLEDDYDTIAENAAKVRELDPDDAEVIHDLARARIGQERHREAVGLIDEYLLIADPFNVPHARQTQAEAYIRLGEAGRAKELFRSLVAAAEDDDARMTLLDNAVTAFRYTDQTAIALDFQNEYLALADPDAEYSVYTLALYTVAELQNELGEHRAALDTVNRMLARPDSEGGFYVRLKGDILKAMGRKDEAVAAYQEALRRDPETPGVQEALAEVQPRGGFLGRLFGKRG